MSTTTTDLADLTGLDFEATLPCEHPQHPLTHPGDQPATWLAEVTCPACKGHRRFLLCNAGKERLQSATTWECMGCRWTGYREDWAEFVVFLPLVNTT